MAIWGIRVGLLAIWLAIALFVAQQLYIDHSTTTGQVFFLVTAAFGVSVAATFLTVFVCRGLRYTYRKRRRPLAWFAIRVINSASRNSGPPIPALGISSRNGSLAITLEISGHELLALGDQIDATNTVNRCPLGKLEVVEIGEDYCRCEVTDRMDSSDFWAGLEERMMRSFGPPFRVEFSRHLNENWIDSVSRLVRRWGE